MTGRKYQACTDSYRYGFNGKENDNEIKGDGNQQDYGMRIHDNRLARFLSVDPLTHSYPFYSPYHFAGNSPIKFVDLDGGEPKAANSTNGEVKNLSGDAWTRLWAVHGAFPRGRCPHRTRLLPWLVQLYLPPWSVSSPNTTFIIHCQKPLK